MAAGWEQAYARAGMLAAAASPMGADENFWDYVAVRKLLAIVLQALGQQSREGPLTVPLGKVLWHLSQPDGGVRELAAQLVGPELAAATGTAPATVPNAGDPLVATWMWLTRTWPVSEAGVTDARRWDGMTRAIGRGRPDPAVTAARDLAISAVCQAMEQGRAGLANGTEVQAIRGEYAGAMGAVRHAAWELDDDKRDIVQRELPSGYTVRLQVSPPGPDFIDVVLRPHQVRVVVDFDAWEQSHQEEYGEGSWKRVQRLAWALTKRLIGYDPDDFDLYQSGEASTPEAQEERLTKWLPATRVVPGHGQGQPHNLPAARRRRHLVAPWDGATSGAGPPRGALLPGTRREPPAESAGLAPPRRSSKVLAGGRWPTFNRFWARERPAAQLVRHGPCRS